MSTEVGELADLVVTLAQVKPDAALSAIGLAPTTDGDPDALAILTNLVRQAPAEHAVRHRLLERLSTFGPRLSSAEIGAAGHLIRTSDPRFPEVDARLTLPWLDGTLTKALQTVFTLEREVGEPWTLVGGLMVMLHCSENGVTFTRATADADLAVGVFTHRYALRALTGSLVALGFTDETPAPLAGDTHLSYRWVSPDSKIDLMVPPGVNEQETVPRTVTRRPSVELPATQQALARSERIRIQLADGTVGATRRPNLLGALVIKSVAAVKDRREPARHREDVVALCEAIAYSGSHRRYVHELRPKDIVRLRSVYEDLSPAEWRRSRDPEAAHEALAYMVGGSGEF